MAPAQSRSSPRWTVRLTESADKDIKGAIKWSADRFGALQARKYAETISLTLLELRSGPDLIGVKARDEIAKGLLTIHVARHGRRGRHFVMFRVADDKARVLEVLRVLHDAMDLPQHIPG